MISVNKLENGDISVNDRFLFTNSLTAEEWFITCSLVCGQDVKYWAITLHYVDYPGEYQQDDYTIYCIMSKDNKLNYVVKWLHTNFALIQDAKAVSASAFEDVTDVIAIGEWVSLQLQKLDLECTILSS